MFLGFACVARPCIWSVLMQNAHAALISGGPCMAFFQKMKKENFVTWARQGCFCDRTSKTRSSKCTDCDLAGDLNLFKGHSGCMNIAESLLYSFASFLQISLSGQVTPSTVTFNKLDMKTPDTRHLALICVILLGEWSD